MDERSGKTLIVGLGSPILRDDAIGLHVARVLREVLPQDGFIVTEAGTAGLRLLFILEGWRRAVIVDAMREPLDPTDTLCPGRVNRLSLGQLQSTLTLHTSHEASLADTLTLGRQIGMELPHEIFIFGVEVADPFTFSETLSPALAERVQQAAQQIANELVRMVTC